jgi:hypothetical protein
VAARARRDFMAGNALYENPKEGAGCEEEDEEEEDEMEGPPRAKKAKNALSDASEPMLDSFGLNEGDLCSICMEDMFPERNIPQES